MNELFKYAIIVENSPHLARESTMFENEYKPEKFALIIRSVFENSVGEKINRIIYSSDLEYLSLQARKYPSWYNYPIGKYKNLQGYIHDLT